MILIPAVLAVILLSFSAFLSDRYEKMAQEEKKGISSEADLSAEERKEIADSIFGEKESPSEAESNLTGESGTSTEGGNGAQTSAAEAPLNRIAFTAGGRDARQRSIPVRIRDTVLGGKTGEECWALFLPEEIAAHPHLFFKDCEKVLMTSLPDSGRLTGANLPADLTGGDQAASKEDASGSPLEYGSGDRVSGLVNGSAFRVQMQYADTVLESDLYVFSSTGTPSMYLDTESGSMEGVDSDESKETAENADFLICLPDGGMDSTGTCVISGRGNSTWHLKKKPYNVNLTEKQSILGMPECRKLCLLSNTFDSTLLRNRISSQIAISLQMRDTPRGEFVNLFLNGKYNGLYYLSQRVKTGGSVNIKNLEDNILRANGLNEDQVNAQTENADEGTQTENPLYPERIALHSSEDDPLKAWAYDWHDNPKNNTGGYLLQLHERYNGTDCWFNTNERTFRITSPEHPTADQVNYLQQLMLDAEGAIYSGDGVNPATGNSYSDYLDMNSWEDMFLLEEYFVEWDGERWSFFITKDRDDPLLYCGPMWDFDHSAGIMLYGTYPRTAVSTLMFRDSRTGWFHQLLKLDSFNAEIRQRWKERFGPAVRRYLEEDMQTEIEAIRSSAYMNDIRRENTGDFDEDVRDLVDWMGQRADFLDSYLEDPDSWCRVKFHFRWGELSHYVQSGDTLGYLPLAQYGETQIPSQIRKNEITGWKDENGAEISPDIVIDSDRDFYAVMPVIND